MKPADIEWNILRRPLIGFAVALAIGVSLTGYTRHQLRQLDARNTQAQSTLNEHRARYHDALSERQLIDNYWPEYRRLQAAGFIGEENRLNWVDVLRTLAVRNRVLDLRYEVQPQAPAALPDGAAGVEFQLQSSAMSLHMDLLHEGNLLDLLADLSRENVGLFNIKSCTLDRVQEDVVLQGNVANVSAKCALIWHTIQSGSGQS
jgi:hypothetical protein